MNRDKIKQWILIAVFGVCTLFSLVISILSMVPVNTTVEIREEIRVFSSAVSASDNTAYVVEVSGAIRNSTERDLVVERLEVQTVTYGGKSGPVVVFENVERAYTHGDDREARQNMLHAAYKAGIAFSKSYVGYIHSLAHALGGQYGTPHGLANAVIMPYVLEAYGSCIHKKLHALGVAAGVCTEQDTHEEGAARFIAAVRAMNSRMGLPCHIKGIRREDIPVLTKHAEREANPLYPVPKLMTRRELAEFFYTLGDIKK